MDKNKIFLFDPLKQREYSYESFFDRLNNVESLPLFIYTDDIFEIFVLITASVLYKKNIVLLDNDFKESELGQLGLNDDSLLKRETVVFNKRVDENNFIDSVQESKDWRITLYTSGTTGQPKKITHSLKSISRMVKISDKKKNDVWGFAYNPTHIAGLQVFFQALFNLDTIINLFGPSSGEILSLIDEYNITNISATPTFYRMLVPGNRKFNSIKRITSGGENFNLALFQRMSEIFPNARILNVYASTEAGSLFASDCDTFSIKEEDAENVKIVEGELLIHKSMLGISDSFELEGDWYKTNDMVELLPDRNLQFKFVGRKNEMINVGGYKVNPGEVEEIINNHPGVIVSRVYGRKNSVLGNVLIADVTVGNQGVIEKDLKRYLQEYLQPFKVPRIINLVDAIEVTRTGKLKRV
ncbi:MAG: fatty acid--CoA ligase family protein [Ignavibacteriaceae bacterium]|jgi:acyl-coenzyme A synthetase/AMP-(fatty) acid ligase